MSASNSVSKLSRQSLWVRSSCGKPVTLCIEPWADELSMVSGEEYLVVLEGPDGEFPAVEWSPGRITIYGWSGAVASVFLHGQAIMTCAIKVPAMPKPLG
jgi:hypothetical protein